MLKKEDKLDKLVKYIRDTSSIAPDQTIHFFIKSNVLKVNETMGVIAGKYRDPQTGGLYIEFAEYSSLG